jgi:hypothetical protein
MSEAAIVAVLGFALGGGAGLDGVFASLLSALPLGREGCEVLKGEVNGSAGSWLCCSIVFLFQVPASA